MQAMKKVQCSARTTILSFMPKKDLRSTKVSGKCNTTSNSANNTADGSKVKEKESRANSVKKRADPFSSNHLPKKVKPEMPQGRGQPIYPANEVNVNDIGLCILTNRHSKLSEAELYEFLLNIWVPSETFEFPVTMECGKKRKFSRSWLNNKDFKEWLAYSKYVDGCYCLACALFAPRTSHSYSKYVDGCYCLACALFAPRTSHSGQENLTRLLSEPKVNWTIAKSNLSGHHAKSPVHRDCYAIMVSFKERMHQHALSVNLMANQIAQENSRKNTEILKSILDTIVLCGQQNFPLRGHRDDSMYYDLPGHNPGNFQALLDFRVRSGDKVSEEHFKTYSKTATYRSKTTQNQLAECAGNYIIKEINDCGLFAVLGDEVADINNKEQMSLVLRYVDSQGDITERFIKFVHLKHGTSGQLIADDKICSSETWYFRTTDSR